MDQYRYVEMMEINLPLVQEIYSWYSENTTVTFHTGQISLEELRESLHIGHPKYKACLKFLGQQCCGFFYLTQYKMRKAYDLTAEVSVYLKPGYTGKGIGKWVLHQIDILAREAGFHVLIATTADQNKASLALFQGMGYEQCAHLKEVGLKFGKFIDVFIYQKIIC